VTDGKKMEEYCSTGQSPQWAVVPVEEEEEEYFLIHRVASRIKSYGRTRISYCSLILRIFVQSARSNERK
jgi:hypothetical protein